MRYSVYFEPPLACTAPSVYSHGRVGVVLGRLYPASARVTLSRGGDELANRMLEEAKKDLMAYDKRHEDCIHKLGYYLTLNSVHNYCYDLFHKRTNATNTDERLPWKVDISEITNQNYTQYMDKVKE